VLFCSKFSLALSKALLAACERVHSVSGCARVVSVYGVRHDPTTYDCAFWFFQIVYSRGIFVYYLYIFSVSCIFDVELGVSCLDAYSGLTRRVLGHVLLCSCQYTRQSAR
jgi:hypothetical protein